MLSMYAAYLIKGAITGFAIAAPLGPTAVLITHRTVKQNFSSGFLSSLGAATADAFFGILSIFGTGFIITFLLSHQFYLRLISSAFLFFWGIKIFVSRFAEHHPLVKGDGVGGPFVSTFILTLTNPMTLLAFITVLTGLEAASGHKIILNLKSTSYLPILEWTLGIGLGSLIWWMALSGIVNSLKSKLNLKMLEWINKITGIIIIVAGFIVLSSLIK